MIGGISVPMLTSVFSGLAMLAAVALLMYLVSVRKMPFKTHQLYAWVLAAAFLAHGAWGAIAVFVLKS
jgi:hypothetical protein